MIRSEFLCLLDKPDVQYTPDEKTFFHTFLKHLIHSAYWLCDPDYIYLERRLIKMMEDDPFHLFAA